MVMMCRLAKSIVELLTCAMPSWKGCFTWYEMNGRFWDRIAMQANKLPTDTNQTHKRTIFWITHVFKHQKFALQLKLQVYHYTSLPFSKTNIWITQDNYLGSDEVYWAKRTNIWGNKCLSTPKGCPTIPIVYQLVNQHLG